MKLFKSLRYLNVKTLYKEKLGGYSANELIEKVKPFVEQKTKELIEELKIARGKLKDIPGTNYKLGLHHLRAGNLDDAILRFKMVTFLVPEKAEAHYYLGKSLIMSGDLEAAKVALEKALSLKPGFPEVKYIMDKITAPESIEIIPADMMAEHIAWSQTPTEEESELREERDRALVTILLANVTDKNPNLEVLDLGCASGGRGRLLKGRDVARRIVGVDMSEKEIEKAKAKMSYDELVYNNVQAAPVFSYLAGNTEKFDVVMAGDVFSYQGNLDDIFINIIKSLKTGGIFAGIFRKEELESGYRLDVTKDKFVHSIQYYEDALEKAGFKVLDKKEKNIGEKYNIIISNSA